MVLKLTRTTKSFKTSCGARWVPFLPGWQRHPSNVSWVFKRPHVGAVSSLCSILGMLAQELSLAWALFRN